MDNCKKRATDKLIDGVNIFLINWIKATVGTSIQREKVDISWYDVPGDE